MTAFNLVASKRQRVCSACPERMGRPLATKFTPPLAVMSGPSSSSRSFGFSIGGAASNPLGRAAEDDSCPQQFFPPRMARSPRITVSSSSSSRVCQRKTNTRIGFWSLQTPIAERVTFRPAQMRRPMSIDLIRVVAFTTLRNLCESAERFTTSNCPPVQASDISTIDCEKSMSQQYRSE